MSLLTDKLLAEFRYKSGEDAREYTYQQADDKYFIEAGRILPVIEELITLAGIAEQLLDCASEFGKDIACCAAHFQAMDDRLARIASLAKVSR